MKYKAIAGDWMMIYDSELKVLTMRFTDRGVGYSISKIFKGDFNLDVFRHSPTVGMSVDLFFFWKDKFKPCEGRNGSYNPFIRTLSTAEYTAIGNALTDIYIKWKGESNGQS